MPRKTPDNDPVEVRILSIHTYMGHSGFFWRVTYAAKVNVGHDWSAYVSASLDSTARCNLGIEGQALTERDATSTCLRHGNKLPEKVASALFPEIEEPYRE